MSTFTRTFNFRTMTATKLADTLASLDDVKLSLDDQETISELFTVEEKDENGKATKYKRKPVTLTLEEPEFVASLPDDLSKTLVQNYIADFVKSAYVDAFTEVGPHDWDTIVKEAANSRGAASITISDTALELSAKSFGDWVASDTGHAQLGQRIAGVVTGKVTQASITKNLGQCNPEVIEKLERRATAWAEYIAESGDDHAEELAQGFDFVTAKLDKLKKKLSGSDVAELVADVL